LVLLLVVHSILVGYLACKLSHVDYSESSSKVATIVWAMRMIEAVVMVEPAMDDVA